MGAFASPIPARHQLLQQRLANARSRTDELFSIVRDEAMYDRPISERHRIIFYLGHVEAFDWNLLAERAFGLRSTSKALDKLFAFGIDPVDGGLPADTPRDWPKRAEVAAYVSKRRETLDNAIEKALSGPAELQPQLREMLEVAIEHRLMHAETLAYMLHRLPIDRKVQGKVNVRPPAAPAKSKLVEISQGPATLGLVADGEFGWDNEKKSLTETVEGFSIDARNVTNRDFLRFIQAGGYQNRALWTEADWLWLQKDGVSHPAFWRREGSLWMYLAMFGDVRLPLDWPVYVSYAEATAYAKWLGRQLPTEAQFHRAAYGVPKSDRQRSYPWGEQPPTDQLGNFDFASWDPKPVGSFPAGASAFGVHDLLGNGWEWTRTVFAPFPGFTPMPFYEGYSANFFDGKHYVMKGGSPRTAACMLRRSFRNWFQPHYPYVYASFRCVEE